MFIDYKSNSVRYTGRFAEYDNSMTAVAAGSTMEIAFEGEQILLHFDLKNQTFPFPHLWLSLDDGAWFEATLDWRMWVRANGAGKHILKVVIKSLSEAQNRWSNPVAKVSFLGADVENSSELPADNRKTIEFVGDSITEGVFIFPQYAFYEGAESRVNQDDVFSTYDYITAQNLKLRSYHMGYGAVGLTKSGCGGVPKAIEAYDYCFEGAPVTYSHPDYILVNHGTNDRRNGVEKYIEEYELFLNHITKKHPDAKIIVLSPFCGAFANELDEFIEKYNSKYGKDVFYINSKGWVPVEPIHPLSDGHKIISEHLTDILRKKFNL